MRDAPSKILIADLLVAGARVRAFDPGATKVARSLYKQSPAVEILEGAMDALHGADALAIAADWPEFRSVKPIDIVTSLKTPLVVDGRNLFEPSAMREVGLTYCGVGRGDA